jgi:hypothetical protein
MDTFETYQGFLQCNGRRERAGVDRGISFPSGQFAWRRKGEGSEFYPFGQIPNEF